MQGKWAHTWHPSSQNPTAQHLFIPKRGLSQLSPQVFHRSSWNLRCSMELDTWHKALQDCTVFGSSEQLAKFHYIGSFVSIYAWPDSKSEELEFQIICSNSREPNAVFPKWVDVLNIFPSTLMFTAFVKQTPHCTCKRQALHKAHFTKPFATDNDGSFAIVMIHFDSLLYYAEGGAQFELSVARAICMQINEWCYTWTSMACWQESECWLKLSENQN